MPTPTSSSESRDRANRSVYALAGSPAANVVALGFIDGSVTIHDLSVGLARVFATCNDQSGGRLAVSSTGDLLLAAGFDAGVELWNTRAGELIRKYDIASIDRVGFLAGDASFFVEHADGNVMICNTSSTTTRSLRGHYEGYVPSLSAAVFFGRQNGSLRVFSADESILYQRPATSFGVLSSVFVNDEVLAVVETENICTIHAINNEKSPMFVESPDCFISELFASPLGGGVLIAWGSKPNGSGLLQAIDSVRGDVRLSMEIPWMHCALVDNGMRIIFSDLRRVDLAAWLANMA